MSQTTSLLIWSLLFFIMILQITETKRISEQFNKYKTNEYKIIRQRMDSNEDCEIPPIEEEDLTHYRKKRMIAPNGRVCMEDYPYTTSIRINNTHVCLGVLFHNQHILTVSDCVKDVNDLEHPVELTVRVGGAFRDAGGRLLAVENVYLHPGNGSSNFSHRIVMLKTNVFLTPTGRMLPAVLPYPRMGVPVFGHLVVTGFGNNNETGELIPYKDQWYRRTWETGELIPYKDQWYRRTWVRNLTNEECLQRIDVSNAHGVIDGIFYDDYLCIERFNESQDELYLCDGDMGAPLVHFTAGNFTPIIIGLSLTAMEFCLNETLNNGTDGNLQPGIFLKVSEYRGWIDAIFKQGMVDDDAAETSSPTECELYPSYDKNYRFLRRKKRLTTGNDIACLEDYPYTVSVRLHGMHWCGGAIIGDDWVLTAAQCFDETDKEDVTVRMGSAFRDYGGRIVSVIALAKHPQYRKGDDYPAHNLAMLQINMPVMPNARTQIVKLIPPITVRVGRWGGENVVSGYGAVRSNLLEEGEDQELRRITVARLPISECQKAYEGITEIKEDHVCLKSVSEGSNLCTGDLGNPAVQFSKYSKDGTLFALAMFPGNEDCNSSRPAIFTKIRPSRRWIDTVLREGAPAETEPPPTEKPVLRKLETTTSIFVHQDSEEKRLASLLTQCRVSPNFQIDLREVNLTAARRKRMAVSGKKGFTCLEDYPYTVAIMKNDVEVICSGVIVAKQWVLTAAMCVEKCNFAYCHKMKYMADLSIRMGSVFGKTGGRMVPVIDFRVHPDFDPNYQWLKAISIDKHPQFPHGNLAMLKFNIPYRSSALMQRVLLPPFDNTTVSGLDDLTKGGRYIVSFFGGKRSGQPEDGFHDIRAIEVVPESYHKCMKFYHRAIGTLHDPWFMQLMYFCMKSKEPNIPFCVGDIGMPLTRFDAEHSKPVLEGIYVQYASNETKPICLLSKFDDVPLATPGVFVKIRYYVNWIRDVLLEDLTNPRLWYARPMPIGYPMEHYIVN